MRLFYRINKLKTEDLDEESTKQASTIKSTETVPIIEINHENIHSNEKDNEVKTAAKLTMSVQEAVSVLGNIENRLLSTKDDLTVAHNTSESHNKENEDINQTLNNTATTTTTTNNHNTSHNANDSLTITSMVASINKEKKLAAPPIEIASASSNNSDKENEEQHASGSTAKQTNDGKKMLLSASHLVNVSEPSMIGNVVPKVESNQQQPQQVNAASVGN